jgi:hypothetical protein
MDVKFSTFARKKSDRKSHHKLIKISKKTSFWACCDVTPAHSI